MNHQKFKKMKKNVILLALFFAVTSVSGQQLGLNPSGTVQKEYDWKNMKPDQRKKIINDMAPEERMALLKEFRENMMVAELNISSEKQDEFKVLYSEYHDKQREIKNKFQQAKEFDNLSDTEAKKQLSQSFEIGQQLLDVRKEYSEKFLKIITPQQVLKLYDTEGAIRNKIMDMKGKDENQPRKRKP